MTQYQFVMHSGPTPGKTFPIEGDVLTIGREAGNGVTINDAEVSRKHSKLTRQGNVYVIEDMGSTNGTFVNGQRLTAPHVLQPGQVISFGEQINLLFEIVNTDPNATMMSNASASKAAPMPAPVPRPAPQMYAGQIPAGPPPVAPVMMAAASAKPANRAPLIIAIGCLGLICLCAGSLLLIDWLNLWCTLFSPILTGLGFAC
jgi:pSer/pThr/pTyr-binding forkhead associated (FHA) protein